MITVDQYKYIRTAHRVYGKKIREIVRDTGHSRNTVRKALSKEHCGYSTRKNQPYPVLSPYLDIIDMWLKGDKGKPKKQHHTAKKIYARLCYEHGFEGSDRTVRKYVHDARRLLGLDSSLVFIPLDPEPGFEAEVDWGTSYAVLAGEYVKLKMFCMRSKSNGKHFVRCFPCERQQALFEGHIQAFDFFGGVFSTLIYDNLTTAVDKVFRGRDRKINESFLRFQAYYNFTPRFCSFRHIIISHHAFVIPLRAMRKEELKAL
ncbi:MAG: IS21 family transposase [Deltaproteobacteria bacterium]|nr:IS21 family transposase [Deltaproteobacteria bacterium]